METRIHAGKLVAVVEVMSLRLPLTFVKDRVMFFSFHMHRHEWYKPAVGMFDAFQSCVIHMTM